MCPLQGEERSLSLETLWSRGPHWMRAAVGKRQTLIVVAVLAVAAGAAVYANSPDKPTAKVTVGADTEVSSQSKRPARFVPTEAQLRALQIAPCQQMAFRSRSSPRARSRSTTIARRRFFRPMRDA